MMAPIGARALLMALSLMPPAVPMSQQSRDAVTTVTAGSAEISGTVVTDDTTPAPARRATVTLTGDNLGGAGMSAVTDEAGTFAFTGLPAGRYTLSVAKGGYLRSAYGSKRPGGLGIPIDLGDGQRVTGLDMTIFRGSILSGTVLDENGQPVPDVPVTALRYAWSGATGERKLQVLRFASNPMTDDRGMYRIYGLEPGEYFVSASSSARINAALQDDADIHQITDEDIRRAQGLLRASGGMLATAPVPSSSARPAGRTVSYAPVYYPAAIVAADATPIRLSPHEERAGIDIRLRMVPTARVEGFTSRADGTPEPNVAITMLDPGPQAENVLAMALRNATSDKDGKFVLTGINPGQYTIVAVTLGDRRLWGTSDVSMDGRDVATSLVMTPGVTVSGRMVFEGSSAPPDPTKISPLLLGARMGGYGLRVEPAGAFSFLSVAPGKYRMTINGGPPAGWLLKSAMVSGVDVSDIPMEIRPNENVDGAVITFTDRRTEISGTIEDAAGKPAPEYVLIVFSADKRFWVPLTRRTQQVRPGADGRFIVRDLPPGDYLISVLTDVEQGRWNDPAFLAELASQTVIKIALGDGEKKVQDIRIGGASSLHAARRSHSRRAPAGPGPSRTPSRPR